MKTLLTLALALTLSQAIAADEELRRGDVPTTDDTAYTARQQAEHSATKSGSAKRLRAGHQGTLQTEEELDHQMPHPKARNDFPKKTRKSL